MTPKQEAPREWTVTIENANGNGSVWHGPVVPKIDYDRVERMYLEMRDGHEHVLHKLAAEEKKLREQLATVTAERDHQHGLKDNVETDLQKCSDENEKLLAELEHAKAGTPAIFARIDELKKARDEARADFKALSEKWDAVQFCILESDKVTHALYLERDRYKAALERIAKYGDIDAVLGKIAHVVMLASVVKEAREALK